MKGPYSQWRHTHTFEELGGGTLLRDRVLYRIPGGLLGRLAAGRKVAHDIEAIFAYRRKQVGVMF
jgi:ligand-binding SRPBCC domain-containing protein